MTLLKIKVIINYKLLCYTNVKRKFIIMLNLFSISKTAKLVNTTTETLRHYDRIDLVKPCKIDQLTGYRYYSEHEIVLLNTIKALRCMDLSLSEIKKILAYDDFNKIVTALKNAEINADKKIAELVNAKTKINRARTFYENKLTVQSKNDETYTKFIPQRVVLLSNSMEEPTLYNLWNYHRHFYKQISENIKNEFLFEDLAGIYEENGQSRLFAVCTRYAKIDGIKILPPGTYLCANCTENNRQLLTKQLYERITKEYGVTPKFTVYLIVLTGILQWNYQIQILIS